MWPVQRARTRREGGGVYRSVRGGPSFNFELRRGGIEGVNGKVGRGWPIERNVAFLTKVKSVFITFMCSEGIFIIGQSIFEQVAN